MVKVGEAFAIISGSSRRPGCGNIRSDVDARVASWVIYGGLEEVTHRVGSRPAPDSEDDVTRAEQVAVELALRGGARGLLAPMKTFASARRRMGSSRGSASGWRSRDGWVGARLDTRAARGQPVRARGGQRLWPYRATSRQRGMAHRRARSPDALRSPDGEQIWRRRRRRLPARKVGRPSGLEQDRPSRSDADAVVDERAGHRRISGLRQGGRTQRGGQEGFS